MTPDGRCKSVTGNSPPVIGPAGSCSAERASRWLRVIERAYWDAAVDPTVLAAPPITSPAAMSFDTLPCHWHFAERLARYQVGPNRIDGGDFEDLDTMMRAGWRYILHATPTVQTAVDLAPQARRSGRFGLRLAVMPLKPDDPPAVIESPPILFTSPSVQVEAGQLVCIHGWVNVPNEITASTDGLLVVDSLSGEALADRIGKTKGWRQFALYRIAPQSGPMCVTFALWASAKRGSTTWRFKCSNPAPRRRNAKIVGGDSCRRLPAETAQIGDWSRLLQRPLAIPESAHYHGGNRSRPVNTASRRVVWLRRQPKAARRRFYDRRAGNGYIMVHDLVRGLLGGSPCSSLFSTNSWICFTRSPATGCITCCWPRLP